MKRERLFISIRNGIATQRLSYRALPAASTLSLAVTGKDHPELRSWARWGVAQAGPTHDGRGQVRGRQIGSELLSSVTQ